jgi:hypothetical protein
MERRLIGPWQRMVAGRTALLERVGRHPSAVREERPASGGWSRAEIVEHLVRSEGGMVSALAKAPSPDRPRVFPRGQGLRFLLLRAALKGGVRIKAPVEGILPTGELPWHALLSRWEAQRRALEEWLLGADPRILKDPRFRHPIVGWLTVPQALTFGADHLEHHLAQVGRLERRQK